VTKAIAFATDAICGFGYYIVILTQMLKLYGNNHIL